jgi:hypothetical protein
LSASLMLATAPAGAVIDPGPRPKPNPWDDPTRNNSCVGESCGQGSATLVVVLIVLALIVAAAIALRGRRRSSGKS